MVPKVVFVHAVVAAAVVFAAAATAAAVVFAAATAAVCCCEVLRHQTGPERDNLPTAAADTGPPSVPTGVTMVPGTNLPNSIVIRWTLSSDDRAVAGYSVQVVRTMPDDPTTGASLFTPTNIAMPINAELARFNETWVGNTDVALLEALSNGYKYHMRLRATDLAGKTSDWSSSASLLL